MDCTIYKTIDLFAKRWTILILFELYKGKDHRKRYNELKNSLRGITSKMLSERLKELEMEGLLTRKVNEEVVPISCEYSLTRAGIEFFEVISKIKDWSLKWKSENKICHNANCLGCK